MLMRRLGPPRYLRVLAGVAIASIGVLPVVGAVPAAQAAASTLTAPSPSSFGSIPVGQLTVKNVQVTNSPAAPAPTTIDVNKTNALGNGLFDYFVGPPIPSTANNCIDENFNPVPIPAGANCMMGVYFGPDHFGPRNSAQKIFDTTSAWFTLNLSGVGVAGYYIAGSAGEYTTLGWSSADLESAGMTLRAPVVGIAGGDAAFWLAASDGGVFTAGAAPFYGSAGNIRLNKPIVGIAATPDGGGYWLVASDGGIFTYGDAHFYGSTGNVRLNKPVVGMASTPTGHGYWLVASDGGIFTFGDARFFGSTGNVHLAQPVVGMASTPTGHGYWLVASDGGIFTFGDARFFGSTGNVHLAQPIVGMAASPTGHGYWMVARDGGIFTFGDVPFEGSLGGAGIHNVVGMVPTTAPLSDGDLVAPAAVRVLHASLHAARYTR
jgi:hypothetical protein